MRLRTKNEPELIWQGRIQIGDEPGVYGDATYGGLSMELPITLTRYDGGSNVVKIDFELTCAEVGNFGGEYPGHKITVFALRETATPHVYDRVPLVDGLVSADMTTISAPVQVKDRWVSLRVEADVGQMPGLYDDFLLIRLAMRAPNTHYADFGFRA